MPKESPGQSRYLYPLPSNPPPPPVREEGVYRYHEYRDTSYPASERNPLVCARSLTLPEGQTPEYVDVSFGADRLMVVHVSISSGVLDIRYSQDANQGPHYLLGASPFVHTLNLPPGTYTWRLRPNSGDGTVQVGLVVLADRGRLNPATAGEAELMEEP